jgi:hypothetical protein
MSRFEAAERGCYCIAWETEPKLFETLGYPRGFCGFCQRCGKPGHTRKVPGPFSFTGAWCDFHFRLVLWFDPRASIGFWVWIGVAVGLGLLLVSVRDYLT